MSSSMSLECLMMLPTWQVCKTRDEFGLTKQSAKKFGGLDKAIREGGQVMNVDKRVKELEGIRVGILSF